METIDLANTSMFLIGFFVGVILQSLIVKKYLQSRGMYKGSGLSFWFSVEFVILFVIIVFLVMR